MLSRFESSRRYDLESVEVSDGGIRHVQAAGKAEGSTLLLPGRQLCISSIITIEVVEKQYHIIPHEDNATSTSMCSDKIWTVRSLWYQRRVKLNLKIR